MSGTAPERAGYPQDAVAAGLVTRAQLAGPAWRRLPDIFAWAHLRLDHQAGCLAGACSSAIGVP